MSIYEQLSRGDLKLQAKTTLAGLPEFARRGIVGDMFALRPRDPVELELPAEDPTTGLVSPGLILDETDVGKRIEQGRLAGLDADSAQKLAIASANDATSPTLPVLATRKVSATPTRAAHTALCSIWARRSVMASPLPARDP